MHSSTLVLHQSEIATTIFIIFVFLSLLSLLLGIVFFSIAFCMLLKLGVFALFQYESREALANECPGPNEEDH